MRALVLAIMTVAVVAVNADEHCECTGIIKGTSCTQECTCTDGAGTKLSTRTVTGEDSISTGGNLSKGTVVSAGTGSMACIPGFCLHGPGTIVGSNYSLTDPHSYLTATDGTVLASGITSGNLQQFMPVTDLGISPLATLSLRACREYNNRPQDPA